MMDKELATLLDATSFQVADLVGPAIVIEGAANHLLSRLPETDDHRWKVTEALGSIVAARKSLESAAESLLHIVAQDGADMLAVEVNGGEIVEKAQCPSRYGAPFDTEMDQPTRCRRDAGHVGFHDDHEFTWSDNAAYNPNAGTVAGPAGVDLTGVKKRMDEFMRHRPVGEV
ncbi:hypothetical protein [Rhodococcoides fascians]|uniref:hypothetical protein n=1 Tax=Rhodococcoides fascians TaxID=1828 RepID=UPI000A4FDF65|nr:hypothetical protein [Rhodococcus fascians]